MITQSLLAQAGVSDTSKPLFRGMKPGELEFFAIVCGFLLIIAVVFIATILIHKRHSRKKDSEITRRFSQSGDSGRGRRRRRRRERASASSSEENALAASREERSASPL